MSQRVNIQFSIDLDDLPVEASRLFKQSSDHTKAALNCFGENDYASDPLTVASLNQIDEIRLCLTKADLVLDDLQKIIGGYLRMQTEPAAEATPPEPSPAPDPEEQFLEGAPAGTNPNTRPNPFSSGLPAGFNPENLSIEELQERVQKVVETMNNEQLTEGADKGV